MRIMKYFQAFDGTMFVDASDCKMYELKIHDITETLKGIYADQQLLTSGEYIRLSASCVADAARRCLLVVGGMITIELLDAVQEDDSVFEWDRWRAVLSQHAEESTELHKALFPLLCIDDQLRMFNQRYFVYNGTAPEVMERMSEYVEPEEG